MASSAAIPGRQRRCVSPSAPPALLTLLLSALALSHARRLSTSDSDSSRRSGPRRPPAITSEGRTTRRRNPLAPFSQHSNQDRHAAFHAGDYGDTTIGPGELISLHRSALPAAASDFAANFGAASVGELGLSPRHRASRRDEAAEGTRSIASAPLLRDGLNFAPLAAGADGGGDSDSSLDDSALRLAGGGVPEWVGDWLGDTWRDLKAALSKASGEARGDGGASPSSDGDWINGDDDVLGASVAGEWDVYGIGNGELGGMEDEEQDQEEEEEEEVNSSSSSSSRENGAGNTDGATAAGGQLELASGRTAGEGASAKRRWLASDALIPDLTIAQDGSGDVTNLQDAVRIIDSEPRSSWFIVLLKPGRYVGNVEIESSNVVLIGSGARRTVITGSRGNTDNYTTWETATFAVAGNNFVTAGIRFENTAGPHKDAGVAFRASGDRTIAYRCAFTGFQDTVNSHMGRHYYRDCAISGHVDFIYGRHGAAVFDRCRITPIARPGTISAAVIATHGRDKPSNSGGGFVFYRCWIAPANPTVQAYLGRPWFKYARVVYMYNYLSKAILPDGWVPWPGVNFGKKPFLAEYKNSGPGARTRRVKWAQPGFLNESQAAFYMPDSYIRAGKWVRKTPLKFKYP